MKTLFLHTPKFNNTYRPIGDFIWLNYMPMGLLAIADYVYTRGFNAEVVHLGVEWIKNRGFQVAGLLKDNPAIHAVGLSLHWHHQSYDVIEVARRLKAERNDLFLFLGGDTASFFHEDILGHFPEIDAVVRGYGEAPVLALLESLRDGTSMESVPNLTWRNGDEIRINPLTFTSDEGIITNTNYTNFSLLRHAETYVNHMGLPFFFAKRFSEEWNLKHLTLGSPVFPIPIGRGCPFNCTWCGGSNLYYHRFVSGQSRIMYRSHDSVLETIEKALQAGYRIMHSVFDPEPATQEYFIELWHRIQKERLQTDWMFECNGLPSNAFLKAYGETFTGKNSVIAISPECGEESVRLRHKGPGFTTKALMDKLTRMEQMGIASELFFTYGLPGENEESLEKTAALQKAITNKFRFVRAIRTHSIEIEPGAPWHVDPGAFGIRTERRCFQDFYDAHSDPREGPFTSFGYYIPDYFNKPLDNEKPYEDFARRMQKIKCHRFCSIHPDPKKCGKKPFQGRLFCAAVSKLIKLKPGELSRPY